MCYHVGTDGVGVGLWMWVCLYVFSVGVEVTPLPDIFHQYQPMGELRRYQLGYQLE